MDREDIQDALRDALDRMDEIEDRQMLANSRIRQDLAHIAMSASVIGLFLLLMWAGVAFRWWYVIILAVGVPFGQSYVIEAVQKREEPKPK